MTPSPANARVTIRERLCIETTPDACGVLMFGASGDLAQRKVIPSLFALYAKGLTRRAFFLIGYGRSALTDEQFRARVRESLLANTPAALHDETTLATFVAACSFVQGDYAEPAGYAALRDAIHAAHARAGTRGNLLVYLSVPPSTYAPIVQQLGAAGLALEQHAGNGWVRVIVEKPLGRDLASAHALDADLRAVLTERQIYRIDHYVAKETVQNICMFRFANAIFEPIWNAHYIDNVQITVAEALGVGTRAGYFESAGVVRDMFQNHIMQLLALVTMEPPAQFTAPALHDAKAAVLRAVAPLALKPAAPDIVRGQYAPGTLRGQSMAGYRAEPGVAPDSRVETYAAARLRINTPRWQGVPFYLRSGKRLQCKKTEIAITFKHVPRSIFAPLTAGDLTPNVLVFNVQPDEGVALMIEAKKPGPKLCLCDLTLDMSYREAFQADPPESYERLLHDCMLGDQMLFIREDVVELSWALFTPALQVWAASDAVPLHSYAAGSWGPAAANALLEHDGRVWRDLCSWCKNHNLHATQP
jgi:glucose-6-phosphate 1-dehydrogenase